MRKPRILFHLGLAAGLLNAAAMAAGEVAKEESAETRRPAAVEFDVVMSNLDVPCAVAVQPDTGHIFVADSGAGRIIRIVSGTLEEVVVGFPVENFGKGPTFRIGPLGLIFLDKDTLVIGDGGFRYGEEFLRVYAVPPAGSPARKFDESKETRGPLPSHGSTVGEGNFYSLAANKSALYVACNGDDSKGWIARSEIKGTKLGDLKRMIATKESVEAGVPAALAFDSQGHLVVGQMGALETPGDSLLSFYNPNSGKLLLNVRTGLHDITAIAFSPKQNQLLALDFAWSKPDEGGLYQLTRAMKNGQPGVKSSKIAALDKPTALAFGKDGDLFVTVVGTPTDDRPKSGMLLRFPAGL